MKPSLFIIEQSAKELAKITQKPCLLSKPSDVTQEILHLEATYAPIHWHDQSLIIHLLLRFYAPPHCHPEGLLEDLITTSAALQDFTYLKINPHIEAKVYCQSVKESKKERFLKASWLVQVHFNPQERDLLLQLLHQESAS